VKALVLESYKDLFIKFKNKKYGIMECSKQCCGKTSGHRTHQNGLNIDFMPPLKQNNASYYGLDDIGASHYQLAFYDDGELISDTTNKIVFEN
jgi:penicillin-insensitive murein endopeptidase